MAMDFEPLPMDFDLRGDDGLRTPNQGSRAPATPGGGDATLRRRRARTRQLQRGFWQELEAEDVAGLLERTRDHLVEKGGRDWQVISLEDEVGALWRSIESANADVTLIFGALNAKKLRKPQPLSSPVEASLRKALLLLQNGHCLTTSWEEWHQQAPSSQTRPLVAENREVCVLLYGRPIGDEEKEEPGDARTILREAGEGTEMAVTSKRAQVGVAEDPRQSWACHSSPDVESYESEQSL